MLLRLGYRDGRNGWCGLFLNDGVEWGKRMVKSEDIKEMEKCQKRVELWVGRYKQTYSYMV